MSLVNAQTPDKYLSDFANEVNQEVANKSMGGIKIIGVTYRNKVFSFNYLATNDFLNYSSVAKDNKHLKEAYGLLFQSQCQDQETRILAQNIINANASLQYSFKNPVTGEVVNARFNSSEVKKLAFSKIVDLPMHTLKMNIAKANYIAPKKFANGMTFIKAYILGQNMYADILVDESRINMDEFESDKNDYKNRQILSKPTNADAISFKSLVSKNMGYIQKFIGNQSGASFELRFSSIDLKKILNN